MMWNKIDVFVKRVFGDKSEISQLDGVGKRWNAVWVGDRKNNLMYYAEFRIEKGEVVLLSVKNSGSLREFNRLMGRR